MTNKFLLTTTALIMLGAAPTLAQNNNDRPQVETMTQSEIEANWEDTKENASEAWTNTKNTASDIAEDVSEATMDAYNETRAMLDTDTDIDVYVERDDRATADTLIGQSVFNQNGDEIASVADFVLDENGQLRGLVVSHGGLMGVGSKELMLDINTFEVREGNNGFVTQLTETNIENYPQFDYAQLTKPMHLASDLMNSSIVDPTMDELAEVDNIIIENGTATKLVVSYFDDLTPEKAMIDFSDADIVFDADNDAHFKLSMNETQQFEKFMMQ